MWSFVRQCQAWLAESKGAMAYLIESRNLTPASIAKFHLGYFPENARYKPLAGEPPELVRLRGRIIVPILSEFGKNVVGIAGRLPDPAVKGWWNTEFRKSSYLYGFDIARKEMFKRNKGYVIEGYFDRMALDQHGLPNSVGMMTTELGVRRIGLIARYCEEICFCLDTDANGAGQLGLLKNLSDLYDLGIGKPPTSWKITMISLPVKVDPDEFVKAHGLDAFLALEKPVGEEKMAKAGHAYEIYKALLLERKKKSKENI
jgi:DNA primase